LSRDSCIHWPAILSPTRNDAITLGMLRGALGINNIAGLTRVCTPGKEREMLALRVPDSLDCDVQNIITFYYERLLHMFVNKYA